MTNIVFTNLSCARLLKIGSVQIPNYNYMYGWFANFSNWPKSEKISSTQHLAEIESRSTLDCNSENNFLQCRRCSNLRSWSHTLTPISSLQMVFIFFLSFSRLSVSFTLLLSFFLTYHCLSHSLSYFLNAASHSLFMFLFLSLIPYLHHSIYTCVFLSVCRPLYL